mmetsp:Transcript_17605/g.32369  ORF Transcript_17605/g.32369 Transcript_17605/m.32369 type:complete len:215 (+) Transcript_17605:469-1113(+)
MVKVCNTKLAIDASLEELILNDFYIFPVPASNICEVLLLLLFQLLEPVLPKDVQLTVLLQYCIALLLIVLLLFVRVHAVDGLRVALVVQALRLGSAGFFLELLLVLFFVRFLLLRPLAFTFKLKLHARLLEARGHILLDLLRAQQLALRHRHFARPLTQPTSSLQSGTNPIHPLLLPARTQRHSATLRSSPRSLYCLLLHYLLPLCCCCCCCWG